MASPRPDRDASSSKSLPIRACLECKRKKTRCDMRKPTCSLCNRNGLDCVFPTKRKRRQFNSDKTVRRRLGDDSVGGEELAGLLQPAAASGEANQTNSSPSRDMSDHDTRTDATRSPASIRSPEIPRRENLGADRVITTHEGTSVAEKRVRGSLDRALEPDQPAFWDLYEDYLLFSNNGAPYPLEGEEIYPSVGDIQVPPSIYTGTTSDTVPKMCLSPAENLRLSVSPDVADHLIECFFTKIHSFVPILHRFDFYNRHVYNSNSPQGERYGSLSSETALILNGMFALAARFSDSIIFEGVPVKERGLSFAAQAEAIYQAAEKRSDVESHSLVYLQGCILLAFYEQVSGFTSKAWTLTGHCNRLVYDLGLHLLDKDIAPSGDNENTQWSTVQDWVDREELRRAWWSVWELDAFASTLSCRPFAIDRQQMFVLLPAADENWFSKSPIQSDFLRSDFRTAWKSLQTSPNQDERAWYLICNYLMTVAYGIAQLPKTPVQVKRDLESALTCFTLILPRQFNLSSGLLTFDNDNFCRSNWIISTILMLQSARSFTTFLKEDDLTPESTTLDQAPTATYPENILMSLGPNTGTSTLSYRAKCVKECRPYTNEILRVVRNWPPEFIPIALPLIACTIIGPAAVNITPEQDRQGGHINKEMTDLVLQRFAEYWGLGSVLVELAAAIDNLGDKPDTPLLPRIKGTQVRYMALLPSSSF